MCDGVKFEPTVLANDADPDGGPISIPPDNEVTIGADGLIFQDLNDLIDAVRAENPDIQQFECSVFNGVYVTRDVDQQYLDYLDSLRNDDAKAVQLQNEVENLEMHNEG